MRPTESKGIALTLLFMLTDKDNHSDSRFPTTERRMF